MKPQKPFAFFQRHPFSRIWQEVVASSFGQDGVVAAYLEGAATSAGEVQPDDLQWISDQHVAIKAHHTHEFGEGPSTLHPDAISDALRQGLERGRATGAAISLPIVHEALAHTQPGTGLHDDCENIDAAVFTGDTLYDDERRAELKEYVGRWSRAITKHEADDAEEAAQAAQAAQADTVVAGDAAPIGEAQPIDPPKADPVIDDIHAALRAAGLVLVRTEQGLVIEKALNAVAEQAAPVEELVQVEAQPEVQPALEPALAHVEVSSLEHVGWSYTEDSGKKYLKRDRQQGDNVAHMVEGVLYEGKPADYEQAVADGATLVLCKAPEAEAPAAE